MSRDTRGYCGHYSNFSRASLDPVNVPVCIFRNPLRYDVDSCKPCGQDIVTAGSAHEQALRYAYNGRDAYIPNEMLQRTILEDQKSLKHSNFQSPSSSLVGARFWEKDYLIYFTGKNFNSLTLKETTALDKTGFNLKVSEAMPLIQVHAVSPAANITKQTHILSRSAYDVFHAHMVSSDDLSSSLQKRCSSSALLEPVTRWKMPCVIADMSTSSSGAGRASVLCSDGQLFRWSARGGMRGCNGGRSVVEQLTADSLNGSTPVHSMRVECSLHPQIDHLVFNGQLLLYDAREPGRAHSVYVSSDPPSSSVIDSVSQFRGDAHKLLLSCGGSVMVLDTRHTRSPLQKRPLPFAQSVVRRIDHVEWSDSVDHQTSELFIGADQGGSLLLSHCIEPAATQSGVGDRGESQSVGLLPAASVLGVSSNMRWDCSSFPVITSDTAAAQQHPSFSSSSASLTGFDVISCADSGRSLLLVHQNSRGDVYAQRVSWGSNQALHHLHRGSRGPPPGSRGRASQPAPLSQSSSAGSSLDLKSLIGAFSQPGPSSSSVQPSSSSSSSALIASRQQQQESVSRLAPIQLNLLCGVRAIPSGGVSVYPRPSSSYALHQQQAPLLSFDMLTFDPARMRRDYLSSRREMDGQQRRRGRGNTEVEDVEQALLLLSGGGLEELVERVSEHPLSLLEVWRMVNRDSDEDGEVGGVVSLAALRRYLTSSSAAVFSEVSEVLVPLPAGLRSAHRSNGLQCQCYQNTVRIASAARSNMFRSSSYGSSGAYSEVVCEERGCPMGYLYCYRRRNQAAGGTGTNSSINNRGGSMGPQRGKTGSSSSSGISGSGTLGCIYKAHPLQSATSTAAALEEEEVDLFMTQQSQPPSSQPSFLMSPLAAAIGGGFGVSHSQSIVYSHQSILNTQNTVTVKEETKKKGSGVTSDLINSLSDSWDALPVA